MPEGQPTRDLHAQYAWSLVELGRHSLQRGDFAGAISDFRSALQSGDLNSTGEALAMAMLGTALDRSGDVAEAIDWYQRSIQSTDLSADTRDVTMLSLGMAHERRGDPAAAIGCYREVLISSTVGQVRAIAMSRLGTAYERGLDDDVAIHWYGRAIASGELGGDDEQSCLIAMGKAHLRTGNQQGAIDSFAKPAEAGVGEAMTGLGLSLDAIGREAEAIRWWTRAAESGDVEARRMLETPRWQRAIARTMLDARSPKGTAERIGDT